jgi:signal transduction histidine kinase
VGVADGLVNASVVSIEVDDDGSLWIGTRRGLSRYQPQSGRFHNYGPGDGLPSLEFRPNASESSETHLHFGTLGGVLSVRRGSRFDVPPATPTLITAIRTPDGPWPTSSSPWETREITLPYGTMLSFEFDVIDLRPPHRFAYRFEGEGDGWNNLESRREITFAGLRPGNYALSVRGLNARGVWSESDFPLIVRILPPIWMTWWFRLAVALVIIGVGWTWIHLRVSALARRNRELETLHRERELALERARESQSRLHEAYERLRGLTRRLEQAKEEERSRIARELHDEMGQALSAVKINLKVLGRLSEEDGVTERVGDALALVDGIIGHVRTLSLDLRPPLLDELGLVAALRGYAEAQSMRSGVTIDVETNAETTDVPADLAITAFRVVQESVHNILRHAPSARSVTVSVRRDPGRLTVTVRDDGPGFDVPAAFERAATGRHLGLLGMRERVESIGGSLEIESLAGEGTTVHAAIPINADGAT